MVVARWRAVESIHNHIVLVSASRLLKVPNIGSVTERSKAALAWLPPPMGWVWILHWGVICSRVVLFLRPAYHFESMSTLQQCWSNELLYHLYRAAGHWSHKMFLLFVRLVILFTKLYICLPEQIASNCPKSLTVHKWIRSYSYCIVTKAQKVYKCKKISSCSVKWKEVINNHSFHISHSRESVCINWVLVNMMKKWTSNNVLRLKSQLKTLSCQQVISVHYSTETKTALCNF